MKISNDVANVLANSKVDECKLYLPEGNLERKLYLAVNKVLIAIKGKWNRSAKAHIFPECPEGLIDNILLTGEYTDQKKEYQFFETPVELAEKLVKMADIKDGEVILEPSAGKGRIAGLIKNCKCIELNSENRKYLTDNGFNVIGENFLSNFSIKCDVIIANPPFSKQQDIDHVNKMLDIAERKVVSVMSAAVKWRDNKKSVDFRQRIKSLGGSFQDLPSGSFKESGTNVNTCIVCVDL